MLSSGKNKKEILKATGSTVGVNQANFDVFFPLDSIWMAFFVCFPKTLDTFSTFILIGFSSKLSSGKNKKEILKATGSTVGVNQANFDVYDGEIFVSLTAELKLIYRSPIDPWWQISPHHIHQSLLDWHLILMVTW
jgi:hypothetical protein